MIEAGVGESVHAGRRETDLDRRGTVTGQLAAVPVAAGVVLTVAFAYLAVISVALAVIDARTRRLPNRIVLPAYPVLAGLFALACLLGAPWEWLARAGIGGAILFAFYWLLRAVGRGGMGGGDVKLAGVIGMALGFVGWGALAVGAFAAFLVGGVVSLVLLLAGRAGRKTAIPFGPWMLAGAWIGLLVGADAAAWYLGRAGIG
jgi:leader peptidase (prepilin peptidase)/N-methyltransferase